MRRVAFCFPALCVFPLLVAGATLADTITHGGTTIEMEFVTVGNPGNANDSTGFGAVDYAYRIGKHEVTERQWTAVVAANGTDLLDDPGYWSGDQPVAHISWHEAAMFCNWLTSGDVTAGAYTLTGDKVTAIDRVAAVTQHGTVYVLPTESEWHKAAYYDPGKIGYWKYPTVSDSVPDGIDFDGDTAFGAVFQDGHDQGHPNTVDRTGPPSVYGTTGQAGNVWEWSEVGTFGGTRGYRGGSFQGTWHFLEASYGSAFDNPGDEYTTRGFRVASIPEPGSITLLLCGALSLVMFRRRR